MNERDIFIAALQQPDEKRSAYLDQACGDDQTLRDRVATLLQQERGLDSFLEQPAYDLKEATGSSTAEEKHVGSTIGPYKLMEQIGEGGFGLVFVAEQREPVRRRVALKLIKPGMDTREIIARFEAERQALALMDHPNIARVLDAGTTDSGRPYFVMDLVRGTPITVFCDEGQLTPKERLQLFLPVCRAVQHAHQKGIIHRDLKPSNLLVTINDGEPVPKVIDFGVAKALNQQLTEQTVYTRFAQMIGTPLYMSPEQAQMSSVDVDTRSDIYSLGVVLYELLTGSTPFDRKRLSEAALDEVRQIIREQEPIKPSTRLSRSGERLRNLAAQRRTESAKLAKLIRGDLDWIVMKALEKDRSRRYETANGFAADIERYLNDEAVVARPPSAGYRLRKFARRNKTVFTTVTIVAVALVLATIVSTSQWIRARQAEQELQERLYASQMNQASEALIRGDIQRMKQLLDQQLPASPETDQRDIEWYLLWKAGHLSQNWTGPRLLGSGSGAIFYDLAVSPDGKIVAATDRIDATLYVFESETLHLLCSPLIIGTPFDRLCFSSDGRHLVAADAMGDALRIFDTKTWAHVKTLSGGRTRAVDCARMRSLMVTARSNELTLWDTTSWTVSASLPTGNEESRQLALSPDGTKLARVVDERGKTNPDRIELWDLQARKAVRTLPKEQAQAIEFSPNGELLAAGTGDGAVRIWHVAELFADGGQPAELRTRRASNPIRALTCSALAFSPDSERLAIATMAQDANAFVPEAVQIWDIASHGGQRLAVFEDHSQAVTDVSFVGDANTVCTVSCDATLKTWDLAESTSFDVIDGVDWRSGFSYGENGMLIYQNFADGKTRSWKASERQSREFLDAEGSYSRIGFSSNGRFVGGVTHDEQALLVWDAAAGKLVHSSPPSLDLADLKRRIESEGGTSTLRGSDPARRDSDKVLISSLTVSNNGRLVACTVPLQFDGPTPAIGVLIDPDDGSVLAQAPLRTTAQILPTFSPSSRQLVTTEFYGISSILSDIDSRSLSTRCRIPSYGPPLCAGFSPEGDVLAIGNYYNEIRLHGSSDGALIQTLKEHSNWPNNVAFSPDGRHLTSASRDGRVLIWKKGSRGEYRLVSTLRGLPGLDTKYAAIAPESDSLAVLHGGGNVAESSYVGKIQIWRVASREEVADNFDDQLRKTSPSHVPPEQALKESGDILRRDPKELRARSTLGRIHDQIGDWRSAVADWTIALKQVPDSLHFLARRAIAYELGKQLSDAERDWSTLIRLTQEENGEYLAKRAECYLHMGRRNDAFRDFSKAVNRTASADTIQRIVSLLGLAESLVPIRSGWLYRTGTAPEADWETLSFDDSQWQTGWAPFGARQFYLPTRTDTSFHDVWLRTTFDLDRDIDTPLVLRMRVEGDVEVFINGVSAAPAGTAPNYMDDLQLSNLQGSQVSRYLRMYSVVPCSNQVRLRKGKNVLAVYCSNPKQTRSYVDVGLYVTSDDVDIPSMLNQVTDRVPEKRLPAYGAGIAIRGTAEMAGRGGCNSTHRREFWMSQLCRSGCGPRSCIATVET